MVCVISSPPAAVGKAHTETQKEMERSEMQRKASQMLKIRDWDPEQFTSSSIRFKLLLESRQGVLKSMAYSLMTLPLTHGSMRGNYRNIKSEKFGFGHL